MTSGVAFVTASIGIATGVALRDRSEAPLRDADAAMYEAKARGRTRHAMFDPTMHTRAVTRLAIETDLRRRPDGTLVPPGKFVPVAEETGLIRPIGAAGNGRLRHRLLVAE